MKRHLYTAICILFGHLAIAQSAKNGLCLSKGPEAGKIDFKADQVVEYLQLQRYKVVLFGEMHNGSFNPEFEYHLITALNKYCDIRHIFWEMSVSAAWYFNQYLATGDSAFLNSKYGQWGQFSRNIYNYNRSLPDSLKLVFHGVDFERTEVFGAITRLAPKGVKPPSSLQPMMDTVASHLNDKPLIMYEMVGRKMIEYDNSGFINALRYIQSCILANPEDAKTYFGSNYPVAKDIAENNGRVEVMPRHRNKTMYAAIERTVAANGIDRFLGIFGGEHISHTRSTSISNAVKRLPGVRGKDVLTIEEIVFNLQRQSDGALVEIEKGDQIMALNGDCKATIIAADLVPGYGRKADFVVIGDAKK